MSRGFRDDVRDAHPERDVERTAEVKARNRPGDDDLLSRHLDLPRGETRERMDGHERIYLLGESDMRALATIGAFRVVAVEDLEEATDLRDPDLRHLSDEGLITCETLTRAGGSERVASLTSEGRAVLEAQLLEGGVPLSVVASILGWSPATTARMAKRYGHIGQVAMRQAVDVLDKPVRPRRPARARSGGTPGKQVAIT
jgi:hypothetical protein